MKKTLVIYFLFALGYLYSMPLCFAEDNQVTLTAVTISSPLVDDRISKRIFKKYIPVKITVTNNSKKELSLTNKVFYVNNEGKEIKAPSSAQVFENVKKHTARRAILIGIPVTAATFGILTFPIVAGSIAYCVTTNGTLDDNIKKNNFRSRNLYSQDSYSAYIFVPKKDKNLTSVLIKDVATDSDKTFDSKANIDEKIVKDSKEKK